MMQKTVLSIEDETDIGTLIDFCLSHDNYKVLSTETVESAKKAIAEKKPDLILLDLRLPDKDGLEFLTELKADQRHKDIPVIIVSVRSSYDQIRKGLELGAEEYITKPFDPEELLACIKKVLKK